MKNQIKNHLFSLMLALMLASASFVMTGCNSPVVVVETVDGEDFSPDVVQMVASVTVLKTVRDGIVHLQSIGQGLLSAQIFYDGGRNYMIAYYATPSAATNLSQARNVMFVTVQSSGYLKITETMQMTIEAADDLIDYARRIRWTELKEIPKWLIAFGSVPPNVYFAQLVGGAPRNFFPSGLFVILPGMEMFELPVYRVPVTET